MKKNEMYFYVLLRDFLTDYLMTRRNFSEKTARSYRQTLNLLRNYFREEKGISFDKLDFSCFTRSSIYNFLMWLKVVRKNSTQTLNLRLSAIRSFLKYCSEEDMELMPVYLDVSTIHAFKGTKKPCVEYLTHEQLKLLFTVPDITTRIGRRYLGQTPYLKFVKFINKTIILPKTRWGLFDAYALNLIHKNDRVYHGESNPIRAYSHYQNIIKYVNLLAWR